MKKLLINILTFIFIGLFGFVNPVFAAVDLYVSPSSGTVGYDFDIAVMIDPGTDELDAVALEVTYDGPVSYVTGESGNTGCIASFTPGSGSIDIICTMNPIGSKLDAEGTLATLTFEATEDGTVDFGITNIDVSPAEEGTVAGASLTIDSDYTGGTGTTSDSGLPSTGILSDYKYVIVGVLLFVVGVVIAFSPDSWNLMTFKKKQDESKKEKYEKNITSKTE